LSIPFYKHTASITCITYCSDDAILFGSDDQTIIKWNMSEHGKNVVLISNKNNTESEKVYCMAIPSDRTILAYAKSNLIRLFDIVYNIEVEKPSEGHIWPVLSLAFSSDGNKILSASADNTVRIWNWQTKLQNNAQNPYNLSGIDSAPILLVFSPDNNSLASGLTNSLIRVWNTDTGEESGAALKGHSLWISCLEYTLDGK